MKLRANPRRKMYFCFMKSYASNFKSSIFSSVNCRGKLLDLSTPKLMGILNLTPDSFSDGGQFFSEKSALLQVEKMHDEGAAIIDIGAQSTRPSAKFLTADKEISRLGKVISEIKKRFPEVLISLDTFYAEVVDFGFNEGIDIINDISGGNFDPKMLESVGKTQLPYILMHNNGTYDSLHERAIKDDILLEINYYFSKKIEELRTFGVKDIILDPGFGFGKTVPQQHQMIEESNFFGFGKNPLLIGISRKSFIYKPLGKSPGAVNEETQKLHLKVLQNGAKILRVHEVAEAKKTLDDFLNS